MERGTSAGGLGRSGTMVALSEMGERQGSRDSADLNRKLSNTKGFL